MPKGSSDYIRTARIVVLRLQTTIVNGMLAKPEACVDMSSLQRALAAFLIKKGVSDEEAAGMVLNFTVPFAPDYDEDFKDSMDKLSSLEIGRPMVKPESSVTAGTSSPTKEEHSKTDSSKEPPFWVAESKTAGFRKLHRSMGCPVQHKDVVWAGGMWKPAWSMTELKYDTLCKKCFDVKVAQVSIAASSTGASSSAAVSTTSGGTASSSSSCTSSSDSSSDEDSDNDENGDDVIIQNDKVVES